MMTTAVQILGGFFLQSLFPRLLHIRQSRASQAALAYRVDREESQIYATHAIEK